MVFGIKLMLASALSRLGSLGRESALKRVRTDWEHPEARKRPVTKCRLLDELLSTDGRAAAGEHFRLDQRSRSDLELDSVYGVLDYTDSCPGAQYLYRRLVTPSLASFPDAGLEDLIGYFEQNPGEREASQLELRKLSAAVSYDLPTIIWRRLVPPPLATPVVVLLMSIFFAFLGLAFFLPAFWIAVAVSFTVNLFVHFRYEGVFGFEMGTLASLGRLVGVCSRILGACGSGPGDREAVELSVSRCRDISKKINFLSIQDPLMIADYVSILTLGKVLSYNLLCNSVQAKQEDLERIFNFAGRVDMAISIARFRKKRAVWCSPRCVEDGRHLVLEDAHHPCLEDSVGNSIAMGGSGILVTGSNMSGKTTFLKTVAINAVLAQTIGTCTARRYEASPFAVMTSITATDSVVAGRSLFSAELDTVQSMIAACGQYDNCLFVVDELFRGTNPVERAALSAAVARHLAGLGFVLLSTHDLAVSRLVGGDFEPFHFSSEYRQGDVVFDHRIRPGLGLRTNALALVAERRLPERILTDARAFVRQLAGPGDATQTA